MELQEVKTEWAKPNANPLEGLNQEQIHELLEYRSEILMQMTVHYKNFIEAIMKQPFHVVYRQHAFLNIDQGMHWIKAAVDNIWELPAPANEPMPEATPEQAQESIIGTA